MRRTWGGEKTFCFFTLDLCGEELLDRPGITLLSKTFLWLSLGWCLGTWAFRRVPVLGVVQLCLSCSSSMAYDHLPSMQGCTVQERLWPGAEPRAPSVCLVGLSGRQLAAGIDGSFDFPGRQPWETCTSQLTSHAFSCAALALYPLAMALSGIIIWIALHSLASFLYIRTLTPCLTHGHSASIIKSQSLWEQSPWQTEEELGCRREQMNVFGKQKARWGGWKDEEKNPKEAE